MVTKARINLRDGIIELEGTENFVTKQLETFQQQIKEIPKSPTTNPEQPKPNPSPTKEEDK